MKPNKRKRKFVFVISTGILVACLGWWLWGGKGKTEEAIPVFTVQKGPLTISVTSSGSMQSRDRVVIKSELEGNNTVVWVIDEGTNVQAGDLLVEFDSSALVQKRDEQEVAVATAEAALIFQEERLSITEGDCEALMLERLSEDDEFPIIIDTVSFGGYGGCYFAAEAQDNRQQPDSYSGYRPLFRPHHSSCTDRRSGQDFPKAVLLYVRAPA